MRVRVQPPYVFVQVSFSPKSTAVTAATAKSAYNNNVIIARLVVKSTAALGGQGKGAVCSQEEVVKGAVDVRSEVHKVRVYLQALVKASCSQTATQRARDLTPVRQ